MKIIRLLLFLITINITVLSGQDKTVWLTYGQSKFMYSPGLEANFILLHKIGIEFGAAAYFQNYDNDKIVNVTDDYLFNFYNANIGLSYGLFSNHHHGINASLGFKMYYGPNYKKLYYYRSEGYYLYYDSSGIRPEFGIDLGISYSFKKMSLLLKYDTARNKFRIGAGYVFGMNKTEYKSD